MSDENKASRPAKYINKSVMKKVYREMALQLVDELTSPEYAIDLDACFHRVSSHKKLSRNAAYFLVAQLRPRTLAGVLCKSHNEKVDFFSDLKLRRSGVPWKTIRDNDVLFNGGSTFCRRIMEAVDAKVAEGSSFLDACESVGSAGVRPRPAAYPVRMTLSRVQTLYRKAERH